MKDFAKKQVARILQRKAKQLLRKHQPKVVAVVGSVGKSSTKLAIAHVLSSHYKVLVHNSSYNTEIGLPLSLFNLEVPNSLMSIRAWRALFKKADAIIAGSYPYEVVVVELGTDHPGDIASFMKYIKPDIAVVTAVAPEHMEFFKTLDAVAKEELLITHHAKISLLNCQSISAAYIRKYAASSYYRYSVNSNQDYNFNIQSYQFGKGFEGELKLASHVLRNIKVNLVGQHNLSSAVAAAAVGSKLGITDTQIKQQLAALKPMSGRMNLLAGKNGSLIIDDTYNSSPEAVKAALDTLYSLKTKAKKIAVLGSMNELGSASQKLHRQVGEYCDKKQLDQVVTVGKQAAQYLGPSARAQGVKVDSFDTPYQAAEYLSSQISKDDILLVKGSQNGVFTEETVAKLLQNSKDRSKLVRQSQKWLSIKKKSFS